MENSEKWGINGKNSFRMDYFKSLDNFMWPKLLIVLKHSHTFLLIDYFAFQFEFVIFLMNLISTNACDWNDLFKCPLRI